MPPYTPFSTLPKAPHLRHIGIASRTQRKPKNGIAINHLPQLHILPPPLAPPFSSHDIACRGDEMGQKYLQYPNRSVLHLRKRHVSKTWAHLIRSELYASSLLRR